MTISGSNRRLLVGGARPADKYKKPSAAKQGRILCKVLHRDKLLLRRALHPKSDVATVVGIPGLARGYNLNHEAMGRLKMIVGAVIHLIGHFMIEGRLAFIK